jgi:hypothetical protein
MAVNQGSLPPVRGLSLQSKVLFTPVRLNKPRILWPDQGHAKLLCFFVILSGVARTQPGSLPPVRGLLPPVREKLYGHEQGCQHFLERFSRFSRFFKVFKVFQGFQGPAGNPGHERLLWSYAFMEQLTLWHSNLSHIINIHKFQTSIYVNRHFAYLKNSYRCI